MSVPATAAANFRAALPVARYSVNPVRKIPSTLSSEQDRTAMASLPSPSPVGTEQRYRDQPRGDRDDDDEDGEVHSRDSVLLRDLA